MLIDFSKFLMQLDGTTPLQREKTPAVFEPDGKTIKTPAVLEDMTLGAAACDALLFPEQNATDGGKKIKAFKLALVANERKPAEVTPEEIVLIREQIAKIFAPIVVGRADEVINAATAIKEEKAA